MILRFYPKKDASIYELTPSKNTGLDAILEINKTIVGSGSYNSRILIDFDYNAISNTIESLGQDPTQFNYRLKMYIAEASEIPVDYTLYCYPIYVTSGQTWDMGIGRFGNFPETTDGVSWTYKKSAANLASVWLTGSYPPNVTGSSVINGGGGNWYDNVVATQSYSYTTSDVDMDVTSIIQQVQSEAITFND